MIAKIIIVGGGAAGLELATSLGRKLGKQGLAEIILLDASHTHIWKPLLHEVVAGVMNSADEIEYLFQAHLNHFTFLLGRMQGLDRKKKHIHVSPITNSSGQELIPKRTFSYDTLVMSVGSVSNSFGISGVYEHCVFLDTAAQAFNFHKQMVEAYLVNHFEKIKKPGDKLAVAIVGAGATGVELSAELVEVSRMLTVYGLEKSNPVKITIIDGSAHVLAALPERLAMATQQQLLKLDIELKMGCKVIQVTKEGIVTGDGELIPADLKVWAAGIKAPDWLKELDGLEANRINQLVVDVTLKTSDDSIFAMGDCAACPWTGHDGNVPPRAQAAHQQASTLHKTIINRMHGRLPVAYVYRDYGSLTALGKYSTIGNIMGNLMGSVTIGGFVARMVYLSLYKMHQVAVHGYFRTAMLTLSNLFRRSAHAKIKMH